MKSWARKKADDLIYRIFYKCVQRMMARDHVKACLFKLQIDDWIDRNNVRPRAMKSARSFWCSQKRGVK